MLHRAKDTEFGVFPGNTLTNDWNILHEKDSVFDAVVARMRLALPSLREQTEIVRVLDEPLEAIERNERELDAALQRSEALRQSILKKAFSGRLVPQDPADEPASQLLARLRTESAATPTSKRKPARTA